jgi:hypothetical protein
MIRTEAFMKWVKELNHARTLPATSNWKPATVRTPSALWVNNARKRSS